MRKEWLWSRVVSSVVAAAVIVAAVPAVVRAADQADVTVNLDPYDVSVFHDTDGDGLGEFEGWGTSLCWWANRIGYDETLTEQAAELFYGDDGLDMNIGRYNIGGGDLVGEVQKVPVNANAVFYDLETDGYCPAYSGTQMSVSTNTAMKDVKYQSSDADFGITKGEAVGEFKMIGWINGLDDAADRGSTLRYTVNAAEAGKYTVKLLMTLSGTNTNRNVALEVNGTRYVVSTSKINSGILASGNNNNLYAVTFSDVEMTAGENILNIGGIKVNDSDSTWTMDFVKMAVVKSGKEGVLSGAEEFVHSPHITRSDSAIPGYAVDVTKISSDKPLSWYEQHFTRADTECGYAWNYDWDADKDQMNVLKAVAKESGTDFIAEAFSNSPPYFMTNSGCSSGATDAAQDNLRKDSYHAFATYMADVIEHWNKEGIITFQSATAMNEPYTNYWKANSNKQEGCHFDQGESQSKIIEELNKELKNKGIDMIISGTDETSIDTQITSYHALSDAAKSIIERIDTHTYGGSKRTELRTLAENEKKNLWMSEVDGSFTAGTNAGEMGAALGLGKRMIKDLGELKASAWILWNAIDTHVDSAKSQESTVDYADWDSLYKSVNVNKGYWGLAIADHDQNQIVPLKKYYAYGQFSRYIRPGYTIINAGSNTLAAYDTEGKKMVIVAINEEESDKMWRFDLSGFRSVKDKITAIRTSGSLADGENWADVSDQANIVTDVQGRSFEAQMKANSITTFIIEGVEYPYASEEKEVLAQFDFDDEETGLVSENAKASGEYTLMESYSSSSGRALYLDGSESQYLTVTDKDGKGLLSGLRELTFSCELKADRTDTNWLFYASPDENSQKYQYERYLGVMVKDGIITAERYKNSGARVSNPTTGTDGGWIRVDVVFEANRTKLYVDGELKAEEESAYSIGGILGMSNILKIGKANWGNGEYYKGWIDNVMILNYALDEQTIAKNARLFINARDGVEDDVKLPYIDVEKNAWYYDTVAYNYLEGTMKGIDATHFAPAQNLVRAQFAVIIYRMNGEPQVTYTKKFPDVGEKLWYTDAILWAESAGVVTGYTDSGLFKPAENITREQMAVMMYRYANYKGYDISNKAGYSKFSDAGCVSGYAKEAMSWAVGNGIITGKDNGTVIDPQGNAVRAECAAVIQRFITRYKN